MDFMAAHTLVFFADVIWKSFCGRLELNICMYAEYVDCRNRRGVKPSLKLSHKIQWDFFVKISKGLEQ